MLFGLWLCNHMIGMMFALPQVANVGGYQTRQDKILEDEVAEQALERERKSHPEAKRRFCGGSGILVNEDRGTRQIDEIIEADNCCLVLEVSACKAHMK